MIKLRDYEKERLKLLLVGMKKLKQEFRLSDYTLDHLDSELIKTIIMEKLEENDG